MASTKLVYGIGRKTAGLPTGDYRHGKKVHCPIYGRWHGMLMRCYSERYQLRFPSYAGCYVADQWLEFGDFRSWMMDQPWEGNELDKDLLIPGNKEYSPERCIFIPNWLNSALVEQESRRGIWPLGVSRHLTGRYAATINRDGKSRTFGIFDTPEEAHQAYRKEKAKKLAELLVRYAALNRTDPRAITAVEARIADLLA